MTSPPEETPGINVRRYPVQLATVFCVVVDGDRRTRREDDPTQGKTDLELAATGLSEDRRAFSTRLDVTVHTPVADEFSDLHVTVQGDFISAEPLSDEDFEAFTGYTPIALLWPYARAYIADLAGMLAIPLAPMPTLHGLPPPQGEPTEEPDPPSP